MPPIERGSINPRMSGWVKHGNVVYTSGQVGEPGLDELHWAWEKAKRTKGGVFLL